MELNEAIRLRIIELIKQNKTNGNALALKCGISRSSINRFLNKKHKSIKIETITLIAQAFNITLQDFFNSSLFYDVEVID